MRTTKSITNILTRLVKTILFSPKQTYSAATRNSQPILDVLKKVLDNKTPGLQLLEVSSGTGQHSFYFANYFNNIIFQPTEYERTLLPSIEGYATESQHGNIRKPQFLDISQNSTCFDTKSGEFDYVLCVNMIHVAPWACTEGLFRNSSRLLKTKGLLLVYGPFAVDGILEPASNRQFDASIRRENPEWGVRDVRDLKQEAQKHGIHLREMYEMPANNKILVWIKV